MIVRIKNEAVNKKDVIHLVHIYIIFVFQEVVLDRVVLVQDSDQEDLVDHHSVQDLDDVGDGRHLVDVHDFS